MSSPQQTVYFYNPQTIVQLQTTQNVYTTSFTASAGSKYIWSPTGGLTGQTVTLPSSPSSGDTIQIADNGAIVGGPFGLPTGTLSGTTYPSTTISTAKKIVGDFTGAAGASNIQLWPFKNGQFTLVFNSSIDSWVAQSNSVNQTEIIGNPSGNVPIPTIQGNPLNTNGSATSGLGDTPITSRFPTAVYRTTALQLAAVPHPIVPTLNNIYAEPPAIVQQSEYVQANLHLGDLCDCNTLQVRGQIVSDYTQNLIIRGGINVEPGSQEQTALGLDGGFTFTDPSAGSTTDYKTQLIDGVITTRKILPRSLKPTVLPKNIILNINDGLGANGSWQAKVAADAIVKHAIFSADMTGANYDYFHLGTTSGLPNRPTTIDQFKFSWDLDTINGVSNTGGACDFYMKFQPIGAEHVYSSNYPEPNNYYAPNETNRHYMYSAVSPPEAAFPSTVTSAGITYGNANVQNTVSYIDSANAAWSMSSGRIGNQNTLAVTSYTNSQFNSYGSATVANPAISGNPSTTYATAQTITELCKAYGKATCVIATCNIEHATPAAFATKSQHRQQYTMNTRYMFSNILEGAVRPDLVIGALPNADGADYLSTDNSQYYFGEISSGWASIPTGAAVIASGQPLLSPTQIYNKTCTVAQYAQYYGYNLYTGSLGLASATGSISGTKAKVFVQTTFDSALPAFVSGPDTDINGTTIGSSFGGSTGAIFRLPQCYRDNAAATGRIKPKQTDLVSNAKRILASQTLGRGYFMMYEDSETDWGGHASDFMIAGFETAEAQKAMFDNYFQSYTGSDHILITTDHEVAGWAFASTGSDNGFTTNKLTASNQTVNALPTGCEYLDLQDSMNTEPQGFWYHYKEYETARKAALGLNFISIPVAFSVDPTSVVTYTPSYTTVPLYLASGAVSVTLDKIATDSFNETSPLAGPLGGYAGTGGAAASNYRDWVIDNLSANQETGSIVNYLPFAIYNSAGTTAKMRGRIFYDAAVPNKLILEQAAFDSATYPSANIGSSTTGPVPVSFLGMDFTSDRLIINFPASMIGRWFVSTSNPFGSDANDNAFLSSLLQDQYTANLLNRVIGCGHICDNSSIIRAGMLDTYTIFKGNTAAGGFNQTNIVSQLHVGILADLCSYYNPDKVTVCALIGSIGGKSSTTAPVNFITPSRYHSMATSPLWVKSYDGFLNFDTAVSGGAITMENFLSNKTITGAGIRKIMDGTI